MEQKMLLLEYVIYTGCRKFVFLELWHTQNMKYQTEWNIKLFTIVLDLCNIKIGDILSLNTSVRFINAWERYRFSLQTIQTGLNAKKNIPTIFFSIEKCL